MLDQSRELNMLACLLFALASGSFARFHRDVFLFFFCAMSSIFSFPTSSKTVSLRCSFYFHVDNRATADASYESRLSASRDIRSIRVAITVPCQYHQYRSLVSLFRAIVELSRYDGIISIFFAVPTPVRLLGLGNSQCLFRAIAKLSRYDGILFLCGASASTPILSNFAVYHIGICFYRKSSLDHCSLWKNSAGLYSTSRLPRFYGQTSNACLSHARMAFRTFMMLPIFVHRRDDEK